MSTFTINTIGKIYSQHWRPGWGSIACDEILFVQDLIEMYRPAHFLEIGMASGLSGGALASMLEDNGGKSFSTIDHDNTFFGDTTRENGFLIDEIYTGSNVVINKLPFTTSLDLANLDKKFQMAFIDANHQHPWPTIDTLCLFPFLEKEKIVIHHDLELYKNQDIVYGIGPKYLHDQFHTSFRLNSNANRGNIFALKLESVDIDYLISTAINSFSLPWSLRHPLSQNTIDQLQSFLKSQYSNKLASAFLNCITKFNNLERLRTGV